MSQTVAVVGAGLSGLAAALALHEQGKDVRIFEARDRIGGRAFSVRADAGGVLELGPAWVWPGFQPHVVRLLDRFGMAVMPQHEDGEFLFEDSAGVRRTPMIARYGDAARIVGGVQALAAAMVDALPDGCVTTGVTVAGIEVNNGVTVQFESSDSFSADRVVLALPPALSARLRFVPEVPSELCAALRRWPTWMAGHAKFIAVYATPFWRETGLSGSAYSHVGPLSEIVDHSVDSESTFALFGFLGWPPEARVRFEGERDAAVLQQLERLFGSEAAAPRQMFYQDWTTEAFTALPEGEAALSAHPQYGDPLLQQGWQNERIFFAGAECATRDGGLIEGALVAGSEAAARIVRAG